MSELPDTWTSTSIKTVANLVTGNTPSTKSPEYYGGNVPFVKPGDLDGVDPIASTEQQLTELGAQQARLVRAGATLVSCIGNLGKVGFAGVPLATNQQINSIEFHSGIVDDRYGYYLCRTLKPWMERESSATTIAILNKGKFGEAPFQLAPLAEQKRIADKLDTVLTRVDAVNTRLARVTPILKRFRQSVLAAATSGRLTSEASDDCTGTWSRIRLAAICQRVSVGHVGVTSQHYTTAENGVPFLRSQNVRPGRVDTLGLVHITPAFHKQLKKSQLQPGDLLVVRVGANRGDACVVPITLAGELNCANVVFARPDPTKVLPKFLEVFFTSPGCQEQLLASSVGGAQGVINTSVVGAVEVPLPPIEIQAEIVRRVETLFAFADRLEARLQTAQTATERLTPALLAKAFRGELVPQDPNDEPASELLRRLQQQAPSISPKRGRKSAA